MERKGNTRVLICVAEAWRLEGEPSVCAQLAQIRALLTLHATDRAWSRLLPLLDAPENAEVYHLAGRILQAQARDAAAIRVLRKGLERFPGHQDLTKQLDRSEQPPTVFDRTDPALGNADGLLRLAEHHLARGEQVRARATLERILAAHPEHARATDLLWALDGDFELRGIRLNDLTRIYAGPKRVADLPAFDDTTADERTETASAAHIALLDEPRISGGFPSLFKNLEPQTELQQILDEPEATEFAADRYQVSSKAGLSTWSSSEHKDTQIAHVIRKPRPFGEDGVDTEIEPVDVTDFGPLGGESEDEDVIVRRPAAPIEFADRTETYRPLDVDPARDRLPPGARTKDEGADFMRPRPKRAVVVVEEETTAEEEVDVELPPPEVRTPVALIPREAPPPSPRMELEPASLPPPLDTTEDFDLNSLYQQPVVSWTGWLLLGMLIGGSILAVVTLVLLASFL